MDWTLTIAGVEKQIHEGSLDISFVANGRTTASFEVISDGSYRPDPDAEVVVVQDGVTVFGGLIDRTEEQGLCGGARPYITTRVNAVDFNAYAERRYVKGTFAGGTMKAALLFVLPYLTAYGVTLDPAQPDGPTLTSLEYDYTQASEVLNQIATITAPDGQPYVWNIDPDKVLSMRQPSTIAAPFDITSNLPPDVIGDITVEINRDSYANRVIVKVPTKSEERHSEFFTGDGSTAVFTPTWDVLQTIGYVTRVGVDNQTLNFPDSDNPATWTWDPDANTLTNNDGAVADGQQIEFIFRGAYRGIGIAEDAGEIAAHGIWEKVIQIETVPEDTTPQALAEGYLAQFLPITKTVRYRTLTLGLLPGQTQVVTVPARNLDGDAVITDVVTRDENNRLIFDVSAVLEAESNLGGRNWRDTYKLWAGDLAGASKIGAGGSITAGTGGSSSSGPALPLKSIQFNDFNEFGGDIALTWDKEPDNLVAGGGGTDILSPAAFSAQAFGFNNHIGGVDDTGPTVIYGPQGWEPGDITSPGYYQSTSFDGSDAPISGYPELASMENVQRVEGAGPGGLDILDAVDTGDYTTAGVALVGLGPLTNGQYDARGLTVVWQHKLLSSGLGEAGIGGLLRLTNGGGDGSDTGLLSDDVFVSIEAVRTSGNNFEWTVYHKHPVGGPTLGFSLSTPDVIGTGTADDQWHTLRVRIKPSTVSGGYSGTGTLGSAVVSSDGEISVWDNGTLVGTATGLQFAINDRATSSPAIYYGRGLWHGYSDLLGPVTGTTLTYDGDLTGVAVFGMNTTIAAELAIAMGLDGETHTDTNPNALTVYGDVYAYHFYTLDEDGNPTSSLIALDDLSDVTITDPQEDDLLVFDGAEWVNAPPVVRTKTVTLTDAQIKALPTTPITLVAAPGSGYRVKLVAPVTLVGYFAAGAYTNVNTTYSSVQVETSDGQWLSNALSNDSSTTPALTFLSDLFTPAASKIVDLPIPFFDASRVPYVQPLVADPTQSNNKAIRLAMDNNGSGNLTGGHSANTLKVTVYYVVEEL